MLFCFVFIIHTVCSSPDFFVTTPKQFQLILWYTKHYQLEEAEQSKPVKKYITLGHGHFSDNSFYFYILQA